jgi:alkaline phosphatase
VVVFAHQRLDVADNYGVKNAADVRKLLEESKKVSAVFQGHSHKNDYKEIGGIHYCTLVAMIEGTGAENSGCSVLEVIADGTLTVTGFRKHKSYESKRPK